MKLIGRQGLDYLGNITCYLTKDVYLTKGVTECDGDARLGCNIPLLTPW